MGRPHQTKGLGSWFQFHHKPCEDSIQIRIGLHLGDVMRLGLLFFLPFSTEDWSNLESTIPLSSFDQFFQKFTNRVS